MQPLERVQKENKKSIVVIAKEYASLGLTLKRMSQDLGINYNSLKRALALRNYKHPYGIELIALKVLHETSWPFPEYLQIMIDDGLSRNEISSELGVDNKTLQSYAEKIGIVFIKCKPKPKHFDSIINAIRARMPHRDDLHWLEYNGERLFIAQWSVRVGISASTIRKRLKLGWSHSDALSIPVGMAPRNCMVTSAPSRTPSKHHPWRNTDLRRHS